MFGIPVRIYTIDELKPMDYTSARERLLNTKVHAIIPENFACQLAINMTYLINNIEPLYEPMEGASCHSSISGADILDMCTRDPKISFTVTEANGYQRMRVVISDFRDACTDMLSNTGHAELRVLIAKCTETLACLEEVIVRDERSRGLSKKESFTDFLLRISSMGKKQS